MGGHQLAVLQKLRSVEPNWTDSSKCRDTFLVNENYSRIKSALMHLDDAVLGPILKAKPGASDLVNAIRDVYGISNEEIQATIAAGAKLVREERVHLQEEYLKTLMKILSE